MDVSPRAEDGTSPARRPKTLPLLLDLGLALVLFLAAAVYVASDRNPYEKNWAEDTFYQRYYATAVMSVCGHGWYSVDPGEIPELHDFLYLKTDAFDCRSLPPGIEKRQPNYQATRHLYLFRSVALTWKLAGKISWTGLKPLFGILCGLVSAIAYGIFRLGMSRLLAVGGTLAFFPLHLVLSPYLRDYAKAPFILLTILLMGWMLQAPFSRRRLFALAAVAGLNTGIALGFRPDILITVPAVILTIAFFLPGRWRDHVRPKLGAIGLFLVLLVAAYAPVLRLEQTAHATAHVTLLGFTNRFTEAMELRASLYEWSDIFSDSWVDFQIKSYAFFELGVPEPIPMYSETYEQLGRQMLFERAAQHPADVLVRAYASVLRIVRAPVLFGVVLLVFSTWSRRRALFLLLATLYLTGYPGIQFHARHYFHLEFVPLWYLGFAIHGGSLLAWKAYADWRVHGWSPLRQRLATWLRSSAVHLLLVPGVLVLVLALPLQILRVYQSSRLTELLESYEATELEGLAVDEVTIDEPLRRLESSGLVEPLPTDPSRHLEVGYLVVEVGGAGCPRDSVAFVLRYQPGAYHDFSRTAEVAVPPSGTTKIFAPIYSRVRSNFGDSPFLGVEVPADSRRCLELNRVNDLATLPPILYLRLLHDWREQPLYQSLTGAPGWREMTSLWNLAKVRWKKILEAPRALASSFLARAKPQRKAIPRSRKPGESPAEVPDTVPIFVEGFDDGHLKRWSIVEASPPPEN